MTPSEQSEEPAEELLEKARGGDTSALESLLRRNEELLQVLASKRLGERLRHRVRSSDILQSTYLQVLKSLPGFTGRSQEDFANWVVRILENTIRDRARYYGAIKRDLKREVDDDVGTLDPKDPRSTPSSEAVLGEELARIAHAMQKLSKDYVRILTLHMDPDQTHRESARVLGRSERASRVLLARARAALLVELNRTRTGGDD